MLYNDDVSETYYLGAYWGRRAESAPSCTRRNDDLLTCLASQDPVLQSWRAIMSEGKEQVIWPGYSIRKIGDLLAASACGSDLTPSNEHAGGYSLSLWNGEDEQDAVALNIGCDNDSPYVGNSCVFSQLPALGPSSARLLSVASLVSIVTCMVRAWEPEWAVVSSHDMRDQVLLPAGMSASVGWITYLPVAREAVPPLGPHIDVMPLASQGVPDYYPRPSHGQEPYLCCGGNTGVVGSTSSRLTCCTRKEAS